MHQRQQSILDLLDEIRAIAQTGVNYTPNVYDVQRYDRILSLVSKEYAALSGLPSAEIKARFAKDLGYNTPKLGVQCALFDDKGKILLEHRRDDRLWGLPGGWVEVSESLESAIKREILEETSLIVEEMEMAGFTNRLPGEYDQPHASVHVLYFCTRWSGELRISHESLAMEFRDPAEILEWHRDHGKQAVKALDLWKKKNDAHGFSGIRKI